jgi:hypothetical protein
VRRFVRAAREAARALDPPREDADG